MNLHSHSALDEFVLYRDGLAIFNEALHITRDCIPGHLDGFFHRLSASHASGKGRDLHGITSFGFFSKSDSITKSPHSKQKLLIMKYNLRPGSCLFKAAFRCSKNGFIRTVCLSASNVDSIVPG